MKHFLLTLVSLLFVLSIPANAYNISHDFSVENDDGVTIYYNISGSNAEVTYYSIYSYSLSYSGDVVIPETVEWNGTTYTVNAIGYNAFYKCSGLTSVTIPNSVTEIGEGAFCGCTGLTSVTIPNSVTSIGNEAFEDCTGLTQVAIGNSVTSIGIYAFRNCTSLTSVTISNGVTTIGSYAFQNCSGLTQITIPNSVNSISNYAFSGCSGLTALTLEDGEETLTMTTSSSNTPFSGCPIETLYLGRNLSYSNSSYSPFRDNTSLTTLTISESVTDIPSYAFYRCTGLTGDLIIPNSVTKIGSCAFYYAKGLTALTLEDGEATLTMTTSSSYTPFKNCPIETLYLGRNLSYSSPYSPFRDNTSLTSLTIGDKVTEIGNYAFEYCTGLTGVNIPNSVTEIGSYAFEYCSGLTEITIPESVTTIDDGTFEYCSGLTSVTIPNSVETIGSEAFSRCEGLTKLVIPNNVTSIGTQAFYNCASLKTLNLEDGEETLTMTTSSSNTPFSGCPIETLYLGRNLSYSNSSYSPFRGNTSLTSLTISECVTDIPSYSFYGCEGLVGTLTIPSSITSINNYTFSGCSGLTKLIIPNNVTSIGTQSFYNCASLKTLNLEDGEETLKMTTSSSYTPFDDCPIETLHLGRNLNYSYTSSGKTNYNSPFKNKSTITSLTVSESVTDIPSYAFYGCSGLTEVTIPNSVTQIGEYAFRDCSSLTEVIIPPNITTINNYTFYGCSGLMNFTIPESVTDMGDYAFYGCTSLTSVTIPNSITTIGSYAFAYCTGLTGITIPESVTTINAYTFSGCSGLTKVLLGECVTSIGESAFYGCTGLTEVTIPKNITMIDTQAFNGCTSLATLTIEDCEETLTMTTRSSSTPFTNCPIEILYWGRNLSFNSSYSPFRENTSLTTLTISESVTDIPSYSFYGCTGLSGTLTIPNSVTEIGIFAFYNCKSLDNITLEDGEETLVMETSDLSSSPFTKCSFGTLYLGRNVSYYLNLSPFSENTSLTTLIIGESVTDIPSYSFYGCSGLTGITIPNSVTEIGESAFFGCTGLTALTIEDGEETLTMTTSSLGTPFSSCPIESLYLGRNTSYSDSYSPFKNKTSLASLTISESVTDIPSYLFYGCEALTGLFIPNSVSKIGNYAFYNCESLDNITLEDGEETLVMETSSLSTPFTKCSFGTLYLGRNVSYNLTLSPFRGNTSLTTLAIGESVTDIPSYAFYGCSGLSGTLTIPYSVTEIGENAFYQCSGLTGTLTIPNSVTEIGSYAFEYCSGLTSVTIPESVTTIDDGTFEYCSGLTSVTIPNSVTEIGSYSFYGCSGLTSVTIPNSVTTISDRAFYGCSGLTALTLEDGEETLTMMTSSLYTPFTNCSIETLYLGRDVSYSNSSYSPFRNNTSLTTLTIGESVTDIPSYSFYGCSGLAGELIIPNSVTQIGEYAFYNCSGLMGTLTIPSSVTTIDNCAFYNGKGLTSLILEDGDETLTITTSSSFTPFTNCPIDTLYMGRDVSYSSPCSPFRDNTSLTSLTISESVTDIPPYAFYGCSRLAGELIIPNSVTQIAEYAFYNCLGLAGELIIPNSVTQIGEYAFYGCSGLMGTLTIPSSVDEIANYTFYGCSGLTGLFIPNSVSSIGNLAFYNCKSLDNITLEDGEETLIMATSNSDTPFDKCPIETLYLGRNMSFSSSSYSPFKNNTSLTSLTISESVTDIPSYAFYDCSNLTGITSLNTTPPTIYSSTFSNVVNVEVPKEALLTYAVADIWEELRRIYAEENGDTYYPIAIIREGSSIISADGSTDGAVAKKGETVMITPLSGNSQVNGIAVYRAEDIAEEINGSGHYPVEVAEYHLNNRVYTYGIDTQHYFDITVPSAGQVLEELTVYNISSVYGLKVTGDVNGTDIMTIRKMPYIQQLDLSDANIVSGGDPYYDYYETEDKTIGNYFFVDMPNLKYIRIPNNTTSIGNYAFKDLTGLKGIVIPGTVTSISSNAFQGCTSLTSFSFEDNELPFEYGEEKLSFTNSSSYTPLKDCPITSLYLGRNLSYSSSYSPFEKKQMLTSLVISKSVTTIGNYEFYGCSGLAEVTIPNSVETIGSSAFQDCTGLTSITIPNSVMEIGECAFRACSELTTLTLEDGEETLTMTTSSSSTPFTNCPITSLYLGRNVSYSSSSYTVFKNNTKLTSLIIGNSVTNIASYSFYGCTGLTEVIFPESLDTINSYAFSGCTRLTKVLFPDNVTSIGKGAFEDCSGLTALTIGSNVESIGALAFGGCSELAQIDTRASTPPDITSDTFDEVDKTECVLNVPTGSINAYWIHLYWGLFFHINEKDVGTMDPVGRVTANAEAEIVGYYTTDGKKISQPMRGMNIVRYSDGTAKKVLVK